MPETRVTDLFKDEKGIYSISRVLPVLMFFFIMAFAGFASLKAGSLAAIPDSWLYLFMMTSGSYLGAKGLSLGLTKKDPIPAAERGSTLPGLTITPTNTAVPDAEPTDQSPSP